MCISRFPFSGRNQAFYFLAYWYERTSWKLKKTRLNILISSAFRHLGMIVTWLIVTVVTAYAQRYLRIGVTPPGSQNSKCQDWNYRRTRFCIVSGLSYVVDILCYTEIEPWSTWCRHQMETFSALLAICEGIHRSSVDSSHKDQWRGALMFSLVWARTNGWANNWDAGDLRRHCAHYNVTAMNNLAPGLLRSVHIKFHVSSRRFLNLAFKRPCSTTTGKSEATWVNACELI